MSSTVSRTRIALAAAAAVVAVAIAGPATAASGEGDEGRGGELLRAFESGQRSCGKLSTDDFTAIGEHVMGRMIGSPQGHQAMDEFMSQMMGSANEERMHEFMARRITGCGGSQIPGGAAGMIGVAGMMGGGSVGSGADGPFGRGGMMGSASSDRDDDEVGAGWMIAMMLVLVGGAVIAAFLVFRTSRHPRDPGDLLAQRFARGEIDVDEYERRRALLRGSR